MNSSQLPECPETPNCVSTQTNQKDKIMDPISFNLDSKEVVKIIKNIIEKIPRTNLIKESLNYLHYTFKSSFFGFIDDVEFLIDETQKKIHFRSSSRIGYSDLGVNKTRMIKLTKVINDEIINKISKK